MWSCNPFHIERIICDKIVAIPAYFTSSCDDTSESVCLISSLANADLISVDICGSRSPYELMAAGDAGERKEGGEMEM